VRHAYVPVEGYHRICQLDARRWQVRQACAECKAKAITAGTGDPDDLESIRAQIIGGRTLR